GWNMFYHHSGIQIVLPALSSFTITPDFAFLLTRIIRERKPTTIIELGGGRSTLIAAAVLRQENLHGNIISIDADAQYQEQCRQYAVANALEKYITFIYAPLSDLQIEGQKYRWYNLSELQGVCFDLLIIDGPPEVKGTLSRYPALPQLMAHANKPAAIVADDASRPDMQTTRELWQMQYPGITVHNLPLMRGALFIEISGE
ncbi:MAG: O-methyltransferase, partial [Chitinophagales bacterium]